MRVCAAVGGYCGFRWWLVVPTGAVGLLWWSDSGQHRELADRYERLGRPYVLSLSIGGSLLNNAFFCVLAYVLGVGSRWFWGPLG